MIQRADASAIQQAAIILRRGGLVAFPTETVYGLGADATDPQAVAKVFEAKGRPRFDPLIVHVAAPDEAHALWTSCPSVARTLMKNFWPGPLSLVLPKTDRIPDLVTAGLPMVAVRMPDHPVASQLIQRAGCPIAAPSANRFGRSSPTTAQAVEEDLDGAIDLILDGGATRIGIESTVLMIEGGRPILLRPGGVTLEALTQVVGEVMVREHSVGGNASPGLLERHYAPRTPLYLIGEPPTSVPSSMAKQLLAGKIGLLSLTSMTLPVSPMTVEWLSPRGDLIEAAAQFFQALRRLDRASVDAILAAPIPEQGLGRAMMDRLRKAAAGWAAVGASRITLIDRA